MPSTLTYLGRSVFGDAATPSSLEKLTFRGAPPEYGGDIGLNPEICTISAPAGLGWDETWQGCPVEVE